MGPPPVEAQDYPSEEPLRIEAVPFQDQPPYRDRHSEAVRPIWGLVLFQEPSGSPGRCCLGVVSEPGSSVATVLQGGLGRVA